jgi:mRNA interferase MazF
VNQSFRWNIFLANLDPVIGSEQGKTRPVLIVSDEDVNQTLSTLNVVPVTSRKNEREIYPNEVLFDAGTGGLVKDSIVLCQQIRTLDKKRLIKHLGEVSDVTLQESVFEALSFQLGLSRQMG